MFKNVINYNNDGPSNYIETNIKYWLENGFSQIGAYITDQKTQLQPDESGRIGSDYRWISPIKNWAYFIIEDRKYINTPAVVYINGVQTDAIINYFNGEVSFDTIIDKTALVEAEYISNRVTIANSITLKNRPIVQIGEGEWRWANDYITVFEQLASEKLIQTPYIIIKIFPTGDASPKQIGSGQVWVERRVQFNVAADTEAEAAKILDILNVQSYRTIRFFDINKASIDNALPIDHNGDINKSSNACNYYQLTHKYFLDTVYWNNITVRKFSTNRQDIHLGLAYMDIKIASNPKI